MTINESSNQAHAEQALELLLTQAREQLAVPGFPGLEAKVLEQALPPKIPTIGDKIVDWLLPANPFGSKLWHPIVAACLPLVIGIVVGNYFNFGVTTENSGFEFWDDELYVLSLNDYTENLF